MATTVKTVARPAGLRRKLYLIAIIEGMWVTFRHLMKNWIGNLFGQRQKTDIATLSYPEEKKAYPERNRGLRGLHDVSDGVPRPLHHHRARGSPLGQHREAPPHLRDR